MLFLGTPTMSELSESELQIAAKNRAWEVLREWRDEVHLCDDETLAAMVTKAVLGKANSATDAALGVSDE